MKHLLALLLFAAALPSLAADRPNIVFIMADDHGRQATSCYGGDLIQTPNIDRLAREGVRFTQAMANNSICSPSRACLLTGKYNHLCGVEKLGERFDGSQQTFPKLLQQAGYQTALFGKWHLESEPTGFDYYCVAPTGAHRNPPLAIRGAPWKGDHGGTPHQGYADDLLTDRSLAWIKDRPAGQPFCLMLHYLAAHSPHQPAERHKERFKDTVFPEPPTLLDDYAGRAPGAITNRQVWSRLLYNDYPQYQNVKKSYTGDTAHDTRLMYQEYVRGYLRLVAALDENVGRVLDHLDQSGLATNTVVIYTSDNGFFLGEHGFYNKMWMYEEGFHIPLIVRSPHVRGGLPAGSVNDEMVGMFDMAPTILDLAGVKIPEDIQGRSIRPLLLGPQTDWRREFYYHYYGYGPLPNNWIADHEVLGVATKAEKLICYPHWRGKDGHFWEYFDLAADPREMKNLIGDPAQRPRIADLKRKLRDLAEQYQDAETVKLLDADSTQPQPSPSPAGLKSRS
jgi:arylsulfatase A-like enzyme